MPNYKLKLACDVLRDNFGEIAEKVGECLLQEGPSTLSSIIGKTRMSYAKVRNALLILIQHNICVYYDQEEKDRRLNEQMRDKLDAANPDSFSTRIQGPMSLEKEREQNEKNKRFKRKPAATAGSLDNTEIVVKDAKSAMERVNDVNVIFYYEVLIDQVMMRLKTAKFVYLVSEHNNHSDGSQHRDMYGEYIMYVLIEHGRLTADEILQLSFQKALEEEELEEYNTFDRTENPHKVKLRMAFNRMKKERFLKRVEKYFEEVSDLSDSAKTEKPRQKSLREQVQEKKQEERAKEREQTKDKSTSDATTESSSNGKKSNKRKERDNELEEPGRKKKKKRSQILDDDDLEADSSDDEPFLRIQTVDSELAKTSKDADVLWTINYDQFVRAFRNESITKYVQDTTSGSCGDVFATMLKMTSPYEKTKNDATSAVVHFNDLYQELKSNNIANSKRAVERLLDIMCQDNNRILTKMTSQSGGGSYVINLSYITDKLKRQYTESIIEQKYGNIACRIFRMLLMKKQLEHKQIAEFAMVPLDEARTLLYKMFQDRIVELQEIPRHADHNPSRTFFLWNVKLSLVYESLTNNMYKTYRNLRIRIGKEQQDAFNRTGGSLLHDRENLSSDQKKLVERLIKVEDRLEASTINLSSLLMFFEDF